MRSENGPRVHGLCDQTSDSLLFFRTASKCCSRSRLQSRQPDTTFSAQSKYSSLRCNGHSAGCVGVISLTLQILSPILMSLAGVDKFGACSTCNRLRSCLGKLLSSVTSWTRRRTSIPPMRLKTSATSMG